MAGNEPVITQRAAHFLVTNLGPMRRLRLAVRGDPELYRILAALFELAIDRVDATEITIPAPLEDDSLVTVNEAARETGRKPDTIRRAIRAGQIEAVKRDGRWLVSMASVKRYNRVCWCSNAVRRERCRNC
jgi:excisionase family DNA binding protein